MNSLVYNIHKQSYIVMVLLLVCGVASICTAQDYAETASDIRPMIIGQRIPNLELLDQDGNMVDLKKLVWDVPAVVVFYRGGWSEYCVVHLKELNKIKKSLEKLQCQIIAISPDSPRFVDKTASKLDIEFLLLSDSSMDVASTFGVAFKMDDKVYKKFRRRKGIDLEIASGRTHHLLPVPAIFVVDSSGIIRFTYVNPNEKERIDSDLLLEAVKAVSMHFPTDVF